MMEKKKIIVDNIEYDANFINQSEDFSSWTWQIPIVINGEQMDIEVYSEMHRQSEIDWDHLSAFIAFITRPNTYMDLLAKSHNLVLEMGRTSFSHSPEISGWKMKADSIFYNGKVNSVNDLFSFSLIHHFFETTKDGTWGDDYGIYLVDCEHYKIVGCRRWQC